MANDTSLPYVTQHPSTDFLVVRMNHCNAGFFAQVQFAINQLRYAESKGLRPVVHFGRDSVDGENAYYDRRFGENVWEYYFEPILGVTLDAARQMARSSGARLWTLKYWALWRLHWAERRSVFTYPYGYFHFVEDKSRSFDADWWRSQRAEGRRLTSKYVRVRPEILQKVDDFQAASFGPNMLGVHARGTDKRAPSAGGQMARIVRPAEYFPHIDRYLGEHPDAGVFFATDQQQFREEMRQRYGERVVGYASQLSDSAVNVFQMRDAKHSGNFAKGEEVLIDALLLSRCQFLLKCTSAVGEFAQYFAPHLDSLDLNFEIPTAVEEPRTTPTAAVRGRIRSMAARQAFAVARLWYEVLGRDLEDADYPTKPRKLINTNSYVGGTTNSPPGRSP